MKIPPCFFALCKNATEQECLDRGLFGYKESMLPYLKSIKKGDVGFLLNITKNQLLGIFVAEGSVEINIVPEAWNGDFPAQIKVKLTGQLERVNNATDRLEKITGVREIQRDPFPYKVPSKNTYGPEITEKVLSLFRGSPDFLKKIQTQPMEVGISPEYELKDVAGLKEVKNFIYQRIIAPFEDVETAYRLGLRVGGGMLLFGPPGTGKTLLAKSIAKTIQAKFFEISPSVIIGYPGEAEKRLESIFIAAEKEPRAVVFLDEAEWILSHRESQTSSVMQRITPVLLAQLSRIFEEKTKQIFIVAATNEPMKIDRAFLRPGRFDKIFYIGLPDIDARQEIIKLQLKGRDNKLNEEDIEIIAKQLEGYSGADIENIIEESAFIAFSRRERREQCAITREDIETVISKTSPSVTSEDIEKFKKWARDKGIKI